MLAPLVGISVESLWWCIVGNHASSSLHQHYLWFIYERRHCLLRCFGDEYAIKDCLPACWLEFTNNMHCSSSVVISALIAAVSAHTTVWGVWVNGGQCSPFLWRSSEMTRYHLVDQGDGRNLYVHRFSSSPEVQYSYRDWADPLSSRQQSCQEHVIRCNGM